MIRDYDDDYHDSDDDDLGNNDDDLDNNDDDLDNDNDDLDNDDDDDDATPVDGRQVADVQCLPRLKTLLLCTILGNHTLPLYFLPHYYYHTSKPYSAFILSTLLSSYFTTLLLLRQDFGGRFSCCPAVRRLVMSPEAPVCALTKVIIIICISHILCTIFLCCY